MCFDSTKSFYCSGTAAVQQDGAITADKTRIIKNDAMQEMTCPAYDAKCPS
jgi:hypothetical protein